MADAIDQTARDGLARLDQKVELVASKLNGHMEVCDERAANRAETLKRMEDNAAKAHAQLSRSVEEVGSQVKGIYTRIWVAAGSTIAVLIGIVFELARRLS